MLSIDTGLLEQITIPDELNQEWRKFIEETFSKSNNEFTLPDIFLDSLPLQLSYCNAPGWELEKSKQLIKRLIADNELLSDFWKDAADNLVPSLAAELFATIFETLENPYPAEDRKNRHQIDCALLASTVSYGQIWCSAT